MGDWTQGTLPLVEGKCPPITRMNAEGQIESCYPEYDPDWQDPEIFETDTFFQEEKDEFYDYVTRCKKCRTEFIAYNVDGNRVMKFCPGCGKTL